MDGLPQQLRRCGAERDSDARPAAGVPTPFERARDGPAQRGAAQALILRAAEPWSPANHELFPAPARAYARQLALVGRHIAATRFETEYQSFIDSWVGVRPTPRKGAPDEDAWKDGAARSVIAHLVKREL